MRALLCTHLLIVAASLAAAQRANVPAAELDAQVSSLCFLLYTIYTNYSLEPSNFHRTAQVLKFSLAVVVMTTSTLASLMGGWPLVSFPKMSTPQIVKMLALGLKSVFQLLWNRSLPWYWLP